MALPFEEHYLRLRLIIPSIGFKCLVEYQQFKENITSSSSTCPSIYPGLLVLVS